MGIFFKSGIVLGLTTLSGEESGDTATIVFGRHNLDIETILKFRIYCHDLWHVGHVTL